MSRSVDASTNLSRINAALQRALALEERDENDEMDGPKEISSAVALETAPPEDDIDDMAAVVGSAAPISSDNILERSKYIPLRLSYEERKSLRLVNAAINVSNYTSVVDKEFKSKSRRQFSQLQHICAFLSGLIAASDYNEGQNVLSDRNFVNYERYIQTVLEIARRYKVMNPEKMRSEYGKLVFLMQDANSTDIKPLLSCDINQHIRTVYDFLEQKSGLAVLSHPSIALATKEILPEKGMSRDVIQRQIRMKEKAIDAVCRAHISRQLSADDIKQCLYSICDNNSFLNSNLLPIDECIELLIRYFNPTLPEFSPHNMSHAKYSLAISDGMGGSRLSHSHELQFNYVLQSLTLWSTTVQDMFRLWYLAEADLLDPDNQYELKQTGQGLHRVQNSPRTYRAMHEILHHTKRRLCENGGSGWIGSSVIHLGDHNVPNALVFIDKYTQVRCGYSKFDCSCNLFSNRFRVFWAPLFVR
jgi:hypothetical protein